MKKYMVFRFEDLQFLVVDSSDAQYGGEAYTTLTRLVYRAYGTEFRGELEERVVTEDEAMAYVDSSIPHLVASDESTWVLYCNKTLTPPKHHYLIINYTKTSNGVDYLVAAECERGDMHLEIGARADIAIQSRLRISDPYHPVYFKSDMLEVGREVFMDMENLVPIIEEDDYTIYLQEERKVV